MTMTAPPEFPTSPTGPPPDVAELTERLARVTATADEKIGHLVALLATVEAERDQARDALRLAPSADAHAALIARLEATDALLVALIATPTASVARQVADKRREIAASTG